MSSIEIDPRTSGPLPPPARAWLSSLRRVAPRPLGLAIAVPVATGGLIVAQAFVLADILGNAIQGRRPLAEQTGLLILFVVIIALRAVLGLVGERAASRAAEDIKLAVRRALFAALLARRPDWMRERASGELVAGIVDQVEALDGYFSRFLPAMIAAAVLPLAFAIGLLPVDWMVAVLFFVSAPLIPVFMALVGWGAEAASQRHMAAMARLSGLFADRLRGLVVLKLFGRAADEVARVRLASDELARRTLGVLKIAFLSSAVLEFFAALGVAGVALYVGLTFLGLVDLRMAPLTLQMGLFCLLMAPEVYLPLRTLAAHYHDRAAARAAVAGLAAAFDGLPEPLRDDGAPPAPAAHPAVERGAAAVSIRALRVARGDRGTILDGIDLDIAPGERIALLGESGIGKSTLIEAIARLRDVEGAIGVDGRPLPLWSEGELRQRVALLGQRPRLFEGSIIDNIRLARPDATEAEVLAAADAALVGAFAGRLPEGLDTRLGERGRGISGGEAQRVALARIFLRDPGLVLLDEPTAHLDAATEARIADAILAFARGRTLVVATHSAALARRMDRIYRLAGGRLLPVPHRAAVDGGPRAGLGEGS